MGAVARSGDLFEKRYYDSLHLCVFMENKLDHPKKTGNSNKMKELFISSATKPYKIVIIIWNHSFQVQYASPKLSHTITITVRTTDY